MDWRLLLDYIDSLKWVVFATVVIVLFRASLGQLLARLTKFEGFGAKADFEKQAADAVDKVKKVEANADLTAHVDVTAEGEVTTDPGKPMWFHLDYEGELELLALFLRHPQRVAQVSVNNRLDAGETNAILHSLTLLAIATGRKMEYDGVAFLMTPDR